MTGAQAGRSFGRTARAATACLAAGVLAASVAAAIGGAGGSAAARGAPPGRTAALTAATRAADAPSGFWDGTDSSFIATSYVLPFPMPAIGGIYGGYIGMIGNWAHWQGCSGGLVAWSPTDAHLASYNYTTYGYGIGAGGYWFMAGPGIDPHYDGTTAEATVWGEDQAKETLALLPDRATKINYPVIFMDIELPGKAPSYTPASDNGWNAVYTSTCSGKVKVDYVPAALDRADLNGYADYLTTHSSYHAGVYSAPSIWSLIFGTGIDASIPNTYEWTYNADTSSLAHVPDGWCLTGSTTACAQFFGGQSSTSKYALMWQWSGGGGTYNGYGDLDQIDANRTP